MHTPWIERCTVQRVSLRDGLVLDLDDYNELVIATPIRLTLPPIGSSYPEEQVLIDPGNVSVQQRPLLDLAGAVCTGAWCDEGGGLHLGFSRGHRIDVAPQEAATSWELYGKRHGYMACLPRGRVRVVRDDLPDDESEDTAS
ncbi:MULTISPECIES: DUF6188 family protein [Mycobacteriaceae]|uniref:DUF6188 family protein n=1 Tax=Mycobacteriaceae TaxID=1762 RepID=UPI0009266189|nr:MULTISPECIES: DUF6188 family protein [Mycobacteriaceae]MBE5470409.1 hypothetical protein [Mycobacteroides abscessus]MBL3751211.1 hypothetical protein [Mycobacteroides abscessus subsp. massiliense]MBZ4560375.1 hypothetical protein [Mycobacterium avium subsp. hominissuis]MBZ4569317.1 hypothetical protein [Mycobacterium avium subsp. hominissuis]MBZ4587684.1 hypothetical protein [Mycobacterium avium subsp. hominissuis]